MPPVWLNLVGNVIKFTPENREIAVSLTKCDSMVTIRISDTGIGVREETVSHIYEKHYQGATARSRQDLGLGDSTVLRII